MSKVVLVTGGSGDIGRAICREFAEKGYRVAIHYNSNRAEAERLQAELGALTDVMCVKFDVQNEDEVHNAITEIENKLGSITCLVNNAGISQIKLFDEISLEEWNRMIGVNLTGCFVVTKRCIKSMLREKSCSIINISSMWGQVGASCETHYSASKGGMIALTKALAQEVAPSGVRVNCLCPGVIDTKMNSHLTDSEMAELKEEIPLGILGTGKDVAEMCLFLADGGKFITGQVIGINGGMVL